MSSLSSAPPGIPPSRRTTAPRVPEESTCLGLLTAGTANGATKPTNGVEILATVDNVLTFHSDNGERKYFVPTIDVTASVFAWAFDDVDSWRSNPRDFPSRYSGHLANRVAGTELQQVWPLDSAHTRFSRTPPAKVSTEKGKSLTEAQEQTVYSRMLTDEPRPPIEMNCVYVYCPSSNTGAQYVFMGDPVPTAAQPDLCSCLTEALARLEPAIVATVTPGKITWRGPASMDLARQPQESLRGSLEPFSPESNSRIFRLAPPESQGVLPPRWTSG